MSLTGLLIRDTSWTYQVNNCSSKCLVRGHGLLSVWHELNSRQSTPYTAGMIHEIEPLGSGSYSLYIYIYIYTYTHRSSSSRCRFGCLPTARDKALPRRSERMTSCSHRPQVALGARDSGPKDHLNKRAFWFQGPIYGDTRNHGL